MRKLVLPVMLAVSLGMASPAQASCYPTVLSFNGTGQADTLFLGAPDGVFWGLGSTDVVYDFGAVRVTNGTGQDFNVYEVDWGYVEFDLMDVLVSSDGSSFYSVKSTEAAVVRIPGDSAHGDDDFARSYDLAPSGLGEVRYIRIDGTGSDPEPSHQAQFDLDAVGAVNHTAVPVPAPVLLLGSGLLGLVLIRRK